MKKLAIVTTHPIQYHVPWLVRLAEKGVQVKVFYTWEQAGQGAVYDRGFGRQVQWDIPLLEGYDHQFVKNTAWRPGVHYFFNIVNPTLIREIEEWGAEALLVFGWNYYSHLRVLRHFHGKIPVYFRGDSVLIHERSGLRKLARRIFLRWIYRHVDCALYVGTNNRSYYTRHGLKPSQLVFSPQAMDIDRFSEPDAEYTRQAETWKKELGVPANHITVLYAGKMTEVKNPGFILQLAEACKDLPVSFIMVGNGSLEPSLRRRAEGNPQIYFMGFQNQRLMPAVYRMGDIYIMPSLSETWGMGVNEAMSCGRPIMVSTAVGCAADLVLENKTGITFHINDTAKCRAFLAAACLDRDLLPQMGIMSKALIQLFSFTQTVDGIVRLLNGSGQNVSSATTHPAACKQEFLVGK
jgi:glycosyltransferase involved in cell wall biosynthesis